MRTLFLLLILFFSAPLPCQAAPVESMKVGVIYGFTGAEAYRASLGRKGLELALSEASSHAVHLIYEDSKSTPQGAITAFHKLVNIDKVDAIIGDLWSITTNPLIPLSATSRIPIISPTVVDASVESQSDLFFTLGPRMASLEPPTKLLFQNNKSIRSVFIICHDDAWGRAHLELWKGVMKSLSIELKGTICENGFTSDFSMAALKAKQSKADAVFISVRPEIAMAKLRQLNFRGLVVGTVHLEEAIKVRNLEPKLAEGAFYISWEPTAEFRSKFVEKYGEEPILDVQNHYDALKSVLLASSKSIDFLTSLKALKFDGASGEINFAKRENSGAVNFRSGCLYQFLNGRVVKLEGACGHDQPWDAGAKDLIH